MLELMRELGFIPQSRAIKLYNDDEGKAVGERYDKVTYLSEQLNITLTTSQAIYVESGRFLSLLPFIQSAESEDNYLLVTLKNSAEYKLPYVEVEFDVINFGEDSDRILSVTHSLDILKKTTLKNLVKPEMRCIYVDDKGAVSLIFCKEL